MQLPDEPVYGTYGDYSTFMFSNATADIIADHAKQYVAYHPYTVSETTLRIFSVFFFLY